MIVDVDLDTFDFYLLDSVELMNRMLASIGFHGKCTHIGFFVVNHFNKNRILQVQSDFPGTRNVRIPQGYPLAERSMEMFNNDSIQLKKRFEKGIRSVVREVRKSFYIKDPSSFLKSEIVYRNAFSEWDWLIVSTTEKMIIHKFKEIKGICLSQSFQPPDGQKTAALYATFTEPFPVHFNRDMLWRARNSFAEAASYTLLNHFLFECLLKRGEYAIPTDFTRTVAKTFMHDHLENPVEWGFRKLDKSTTARSRERFFISAYEWCSRVSHQFHEDEPLRGKIYIGNDLYFQEAVSLIRPVKLTNERAVGKLILASSEECYPKASGDEVTALGHFRYPDQVLETCEPDLVSPDAVGHSQEEQFVGGVIEFKGRGAFRWWYRDKPILDVVNGNPTVPQARITEEAFAAEFSGRFPNEDYRGAWELVRAVADGGHGTMIIISVEAAAEASRIDIGHAVKPFKPTKAQVRAFSVIDGGLMIDPTGNLHAFGIILDGLSVPGRGEIARGARYNSGIKYSCAYYSKYGSVKGLLIAIISQDGMIDLRGPDAPLNGSGLQIGGHPL
jgi:hypothetical protein